MLRVHAWSIQNNAANSKCFVYNSTCDKDN